MTTAKKVAGEVLKGAASGALRGAAAAGAKAAGVDESSEREQSAD
jgi:hypothetical protein